jgi:hypothetical protein
MSELTGIQADKRSGAFMLPGGVVDPALTREAFLASPLAEGHEIFVQNEPWCSYKLKRFPVQDTEFIVVLFFADQRLTTVSLFDALPELTGGSWDDWSEEKEMARKRRHEEWLARWDLPIGTYPWGTVDSVYDPRSGASDIWVTYRDPDEPSVVARLMRRLTGNTGDR